MYRSTVLDNGLHVCTEAISTSRACSIGITIDVGLADEGASKAGLAHFVEHLMFQGTSSRDSMSIARVIDAAGGRMGGMTTRDYTCYQATVPDEYVPYAMDLFGDLLLNSVFPEAAVESEKAAIAHEIERANDDPESLLNDILKRHVWESHPLGRPIAGSLESVSRLTREDAIYFVGMNYLPGRTSIAAAGNVDHDDFVAQVRDGFWRMIGELPRVESCPPKFRPGLTVELRPLAQVYFALALPAPEFSSANRINAHLITTMLGGGISSRLFRRLREDRGLVYHVAADYQAFRQAGLLVIEGCTSAEHLPEVIATVREEIDSIASIRWDEDELWKARMNLRGRHLLSSEDVETRMARLATQHLYLGRHQGSSEILADIDAVSPDVLSEFCRQSIKPIADRPALAVVGEVDVEKLKSVMS